MIIIAIYLGTNGNGKVKDIYLGVNGVKKLREIYVGVGGQPKKVWPDNGKFGTLTTLDEAGYLPLLELDSTHVLGMKSFTINSTSFTLDLSIMSSEKNGFLTLGTAKKSFTIPAKPNGAHFCSAFWNVHVIRYSQNGLYLVFNTSSRSGSSRYGRLHLVKVTTATMAVTIHDMVTYTVDAASYTSISNNAGYDFMSGNKKYGAFCTSVHSYEDETDDIYKRNYPTITIDANGTTTRTGESINDVFSNSPIHDNRMVGGGSRYVNFRVSGNYTYDYKHFKSKTTSGTYLCINNRDKTTGKHQNYGSTTMPNGAPYALICVSDGVYSYRSSSLWAYPLLSNQDLTATIKMYIMGIVLNADMDLLVVHKSSIRSTSSNGKNKFELYRFNKTNMTVGALLDTYSFTGSVYGMRACGQGICIMSSPNISAAANRTTRYISI